MGIFSSRQLSCGFKTTKCRGVEINIALVYNGILAPVGAVKKSRSTRVWIPRPIMGTGKTFGIYIATTLRHGHMNSETWGSVIDARRNVLGIAKVPLPPYQLLKVGQGGSNMQQLCKDLITVTNYFEL